MTSAVERALVSALRTRAAAKNGPATGLLDIDATTGLETPKVVDLSGKQGQVTIPKRVRDRWVVNVRMNVEIFGVSVNDVLVVLPRSQHAKRWQRDNNGKSYPLTLGANGQITVPRSLQMSWATRSVILIDMGYGVGLAPVEQARDILNEVRPPTNATRAER